MCNLRTHKRARQGRGGGKRGSPRSVFRSTSLFIGALPRPISRAIVARNKASPSTKTSAIYSARFSRRPRRHTYLRLSLISKVSTAGKPREIEPLRRRARLIHTLGQDAGRSSGSIARSRIDSRSHLPEIPSRLPSISSHVCHARYAGYFVSRLSDGWLPHRRLVRCIYLQRPRRCTCMRVRTHSRTHARSPADKPALSATRVLSALGTMASRLHVAPGTVE